MMCYVGSIICSERLLTTFYSMMLQHMPSKVLLLLVAVLWLQTSSVYFPLTNQDGPKPKADGESYLSAAMGLCRKGSGLLLGELQISLGQELPAARAAAPLNTTGLRLLLLYNPFLSSTRVFGR